ncbi:hypothetical protein [Synechococcus sp. PCC 7336]|uniref:hypothetical protein n=1 Tax=Synechococcus sp. PCC 7336 TaxID=195250 RepID=UPI0003486053|nr:hypothetical protein [Synechococcus sp. PCC 7336]
MSIEELLQQARQLAPEEQLQLISSLVDNIQELYQNGSPRPCWSDVRGTSPYPLIGEDAQEWVSGTRQEGDNLRAQYLPRKA